MSAAFKRAQPHWAWASIGLALLACAETPAPPLPPTPDNPARQASPPPASPADPAVEQLGARAVYDHDFARTRLYTWTRVEQLEPLRESHRLLVADALTGGWTSPYIRALEQLSAASDESGQLARLLHEHPDLRRHRYAWTSPFATSLGLGERRYGNVLIQIELDPRAWIGRFEPGAAEPFRFVDLEGAPIEPARVHAEPTRIAAIFHVSGPPRARAPMREYVLCSEAMIREWSVATDEIRSLVAQEIQLLEQLRTRTFAQLPRAALVEPAMPDWTRAQPSAPPLALWHASLAFDIPRYRPGRAEFDALLASLAGLRDDGGPPLRVYPSQSGTP